MSPLLPSRVSARSRGLACTPLRQTGSWTARLPPLGSRATAGRRSVVPRAWPASPHMPAGAPPDRMPTFVGILDRATLTRTVVRNLLPPGDKCSPGQGPRLHPGVCNAVLHPRGPRPHLSHSAWSPERLPLPTTRLPAEWSVTRGGQGPHVPVLIEELFAVAADVRDAITRLTGRATDAAQGGKSELAGTVVLEICEALAQRHNSSRGAQ